ncbi:MAG TPA: hypothetical protein VHL58_18355 [Thermoanaerobaculia bacterium]|nr:hypothetical protein [Thermoanaerobaculia bacterium]
MKTTSVSAFTALVLWTFLATVSADVFGPRITFARIKPADVNLGAASRIEVVEFSGALAEVAANEFEAAAASEGFLTIVLPVTFPAKPALTLRERSLAKPLPDITLRAHLDDFTTHNGSSRRGSEQNNTSASSEYWVDARCSLHVEIYDPSGASITALNVTGASTSSHGPALSAAMEHEAKENAARRAGAAAGAKISPRRVTESIRLERDVPRFDEAYRLIRDGSFDKARDLWVTVVRSDDHSAALRYDLGAVCEALGDQAAARANYDAAIRLNPLEPKYGECIERLDHWTRETAMLHARISPLPQVSPRPASAGPTRAKKR